MIDLTLDLKETNYSKEELASFKDYLFYSDADSEKYHEIIDKLIEDRSKEAVDIFYNLSLFGDPTDTASFGLGYILFIGKGAIPEILKLLTSDDPKRAFSILYDLHNEMGLKNYSNIDSDNLEAFKYLLYKHEDWVDTVEFLSGIKSLASDDVKYIIRGYESRYLYKS